MEKKQIYTIFLFQFKQDRKAAETVHDINETFGPGTTTECTAQWWFKKFRGGDENLEDDVRRGRPSDVDNDQLRALVEANTRTTIRELASELDVTYTKISNHLRKIGKTKKLDNWVPHELNDNQKKRHYEVSSSLLSRNKNDPFLDRVVTCNEKWVLYDNRRRSALWFDADKAPRHFPKPELHQKKVILSRPLTYRLPLFQESWQLSAWEIIQKPKRYQKRHQRLNHYQNVRFLRYWHKYTCLALAKLCWFWWCLFRSINFCFELRYVHLNLKVKNCKNFLVNVIFLSG